MKCKDVLSMRTLLFLPPFLLFVAYFILRIVMIIVVQTFDFVIYSRKLQLNLWDIAWTTDLFMGIIGSLSAAILFKNKLPSLILLLMTTFSFYIWFIAMITQKNLTPIQHPEVQEHYIFEKYVTPTEYKDMKQLSVIIYKEQFPLLYKHVNETTLRVSSEHNRETITRLNDGTYVVNEKENAIYFGVMKVPLHE